MITAELMKKKTKNERDSKVQKTKLLKKNQCNKYSYFYDIKSNILNKTFEKKNVRGIKKA